MPEEGESHKSDPSTSSENESTIAVEDMVLNFVGYSKDRPTTTG